MSDEPEPVIESEPDPEERRTYIGSSDAPMIVGASPWGGPLTTWHRLVGLSPVGRRPSLRMWLGERLEPILLDLYAERTGRRPARVCDPHGPPIRSADRPHIGAHPDYDRLELKTTTRRDDWGEDGATVTRREMLIPLHVWVQVQHQLHVMGWDVLDVAVLLGHDDFRVYEVPADKRFIKGLVAAEDELWRQAQSGEMPAPISPDERAALLRFAHPREKLPARPATPEEVALVGDWRAAAERLAEAKRSRDELADRVKMAIGDAAGLSGLATYKHQTTRRLNPDRARAELLAIGRRDIIDRATDTTESRVLLPVQTGGSR